MLKKVLVILLAVCIALSAFSALSIISETKASPGPVVLVEPQEIVIPYCNTDCVTIGVANFTDLFGFEFKIWWRKAAVNMTSYSWRASPWSPYLTAGPLFEENATHKSAYLGITAFPPASPKSYVGTWPFIDLYWHCENPNENSSLTFDRAYTHLVDDLGYLIPIESFIDGHVTNVPNVVTIDYVQWTPTNPPPYVHSSTPRANEPVLVTSNISGPIGEVQLCYRVDSGAWWNTTMTHNMTSGLWNHIIPSQPGNTTVDFFVKASNTIGQWSQTSLINFNVEASKMGDINGDGYVNAKDAIILGVNFDY